MDERKSRADVRLADLVPPARGLDAFRERRRRAVRRGQRARFAVAALAVLALAVFLPRPPGSEYDAGRQLVELHAPGGADGAGPDWRATPLARVSGVAPRTLEISGAASALPLPSRRPGIRIVWIVAETGAGYGPPAGAPR